MNLEQLFKKPEFVFSTNIELELYKLLEDCGIPKRDILLGAYDIHIGKAKERLVDEMAKLAIELENENKISR